MSICKDAWSIIAQYLTIPEQVRYLGRVSKDTKDFVDDIKDNIHKNILKNTDISSKSFIHRMFSKELSETFKKYMACLMAQWVPILNTIDPDQFSNFEQQKIIIGICEHNLLFSVNNSRNLHKFVWPYLRSCLRDERLMDQEQISAVPGGKVSSRSGSKSIISSYDDYPY